MFGCVVCMTRCDMTWNAMTWLSMTSEELRPLGIVASMPFSIICPLAGNSQPWALFRRPVLLYCLRSNISPQDKHLSTLPFLNDSFLILFRWPAKLMIKGSFSIRTRSGLTRSGVTDYYHGTLTKVYTSGTGTSSYYDFTSSLLSYVDRCDSERARKEGG